MMRTIFCAERASLTECWKKEFANHPLVDVRQGASWSRNATPLSARRTRSASWTADWIIS